MVELTSIIKSVQLNYTETTRMGDESRHFIVTSPPVAKGEIYMDHGTALAFEGQMTNEESSELTSLLERVAARLTEEVRANLST